MKQFITKTLLSAMALGLAVGCSSTQFAAVDSTGSNSITPATTPTPGTTPTPTSSTCSSGEVALTVSQGSINGYTKRSVVSYNNVKVYVNTYDVSGGRYAGQVVVSYYDVSGFHTSSFSAPDGTNVTVPTLADNGTYTAEYNRWFYNSQYFSGFYQDRLGAIVLTVDGVNANGCASGSVYYKNFDVSDPDVNTQSPYRTCWFIRGGPYACRSDAVINKTALVPDGYTLLGTFSGLSKAVGFR